jgi:hypothetical protein
MKIGIPSMYGGGIRSTNQSNKKANNLRLLHSCIPANPYPLWLRRAEGGFGAMFEFKDFSALFMPAKLIMEVAIYTIRASESIFSLVTLA